MNAKYWDEIETLLAEQIYASKVPVSAALQSACRAFPDAPIQTLTLALASLATSLELEWISGPLAGQKALFQVHQEILELSVDLAFNQIFGKNIVSCRDLLSYRSSEMNPRQDSL